MSKHFIDLIAREVDVALRQLRQEMETSEKQDSTTTKRDSSKRISIKTLNHGAVISISIFSE